MVETRTRSATPAFAPLPAPSPAAPPAANSPAANGPAANAPATSVPPPAAPAVTPLPGPSAPSLPPPAAAPSEAEPCRAFGAFGAPEPITGLGIDIDSFGPVFSADGLTLFFSAVGGDEDIYSAVRQPHSAHFSAATAVPQLDAGGTEEGTPFLSFDGLSLYFFSTRPGAGVQGDRDLWVVHRPAPDATFAEPSVLPAVNSPSIDHLPRLSRDERTLVFVSGRDSPNEGSNLWITRRGNKSEEFAAPVEVEGINTNAREEGCSLSDDGLTLFFASNRQDEADMDLFVATRADAAASFEAVEPLVDLNSTAQDLDPQLSPDGLELFFASSRAGPVQLFRAVRECLER
jgi:Tol biopolymer transport system component